MLYMLILFFCCRVTELLDIAPVDFFSGISYGCSKDIPFLPDEFKAKVLDIEFYWVTEIGDTPG